MTGACCRDTWGLRGLKAGPRRQSWPEGGEGLAKEDMASLESRDQSKGYTQPTSDRIHLKGFEGTLDGVTRYPKRLLINTPHTTPRALLRAAGKVWGQLRDSMGVGERGSSVAHWRPSFRITSLGPQASTSSSYAFSSICKGNVTRWSQGLS